MLHFSAMFCKLLIVSKSKYYGMEASNGQPTPKNRRALGVRIQQVSVLPRVQDAQPEHDSVRIQIDLLYGMDTQTLGPLCWIIIRYPSALLHCTKKSLQANGIKNHRYRRSHRFSRAAWMVDGQVWAQGRLVCHGKSPASEPVSTRCALGHCVSLLFCYALEWLVYPPYA